MICIFIDICTYLFMSYITPPSSVRGHAMPTGFCASLRMDVVRFWYASVSI